MRLGVVFPQTEIGTDPGPIRAFAQAAEELGYLHILAFDHVLGADIRDRPGWNGAYDYTHLFHEPFVLFGYLAAVTSRAELVTSVLILGQRQTALVAKQAAEVDVLTGGRLRLGIGIGWNEVEYEALNENFHNRGARSEEQVALMRALWTQEVVNFDGRWHKVTAAGINPLPVQRPISVWFGGRADAVLRRIARIGDGFIMSSNQPPQRAQRRGHPAHAPVCSRSGPGPGIHRPGLSGQPQGGPGWGPLAGGPVAGAGGHPPELQPHERRPAHPRRAY